MFLIKLQRRKRIFFTLGCSFMLGILVINLFVDPLQHPQVKLARDQDDGSLLLENGKMSNEKVFGNNVHVGSVQRKPKAAYDRHLNENENSNQIAAEKSQWKFNIHNPLGNSALRGLADGVNKKHDDEDDKDYVYEEDIYKVVIEGDQDEDSEEEEDEEEEEEEEVNDGESEKDIINSVQRKQNKEKILKFHQTKQFRNHSTKQRNNNSTQRVDKLEVSWKISDILQPNRIYWSDAVEKLIPPGETLLDSFDYVKRIRDEQVQYLEPPAWDKCGRPKNGYVTFQNGLHVCARYREPHNKMVLGEVLSYYLSRFLGMDSVPAVVLSRTNHSNPQWGGVSFKELEWKEGTFVALIQWIPNIESFGSLVKMPQILLDAYWNKTVINTDFLKHVGVTSPSLLSQLHQWGEMILFDYITGNYDRIASMQDAVLKENKPSILSEHIRNLHKSTETDKLWLIDNESGLFDAYELMYHAYRGDKFVKFHRDMLQTFCIFPQSFIESLRRLDQERQPHDFLISYAKIYEPLIDEVPKDMTYTYFQQHFQARIKDILYWVESCESHV